MEDSRHVYGFTTQTPALNDHYMHPSPHPAAIPALFAWAGGKIRRTMLVRDPDHAWFCPACPGHTKPGYLKGDWPWVDV